MQSMKMSDEVAFAPFSSEEDIANLRALVIDCRRCMDEEITIETVREKLRRLPGHAELKAVIAELFTVHDGVVLPDGMICSLAIGQIRREIVEVENQLNPDLDAIPIIDVEPVDSDTDWEGMDSDELADRTTDEDSDEDVPPIARRIEYPRLRL